MDTKITLDIDDFLSDDEKRAILKEAAEKAFREQIYWNNHYGLKKDDVVVKMAYNMIKRMVAEQMGIDDIGAVIRDQVVKTLKEGLSMRFIIGSEYDPKAWNEQLPGYRLVEQAVKDNEQVLRDRVKQILSEYDFKADSEFDMAQIIADALTEVITHRPREKWSHDAFLGLPHEEPQNASVDSKNEGSVK